MAAEKGHAKVDNFLNANKEFLKGSNLWLLKDVT